MEVADLTKCSDTEYGLSSYVGTLANNACSVHPTCSVCSRLARVVVVTINRENQVQEKRRIEHVLASSAASAACTCCRCYCFTAHPYRAAATSMRCHQDRQSLASFFKPACQVTRWRPRSLHHPVSSWVSYPSLQLAYVET